MTKLLAVLFLSVCLYAQTHTEVTVEDAQTISGNKTFSGTNTHSGVETFKNINAVRFADQFAGADAGAKIVAAIADLPSTGGTVDARGLEGAQAIGSTITIAKPITLLFGNTTFAVSAAKTFQINVQGVSLIGQAVSQAFTSPGTNNVGTTFQVNVAASTWAELGANKISNVTSISRSSNTVTVAFPNFSPVSTLAAGGGNKVTLAGVTDNGTGTSFNGDFALLTSVVGGSNTTITFSQTGADGTGSGGTAQAYFDNNEYDGITQGTRFENIHIHNNAGDTPLLWSGAINYGAGSYGIRDWRGGGIVARNLRFTAWEYGFWGVQSDINSWENIFVTYSHYGMYFGPRSDQQTIYHLYSQFNDTALWIDKAVTRVYASQFVGDGSATTYPIKIGSQWTAGAEDVVFEDCWFEHFQGYVGGNINAFVSIGLGDSQQSKNIVFNNPFILGGHPGSPPSVSYFISMDNADLITVRDLIFEQYDTLRLTSLVQFQGTTSPSQVFLAYKGATEPGWYTNSGSGVPRPTISYFKSGDVQMKNKADQPFNLVLAGGAAADQNTQLQFADKADALKWSVLKTNGNLFRIFNNATSVTRLQMTSGSGTDVATEGSGAFRFNPANGNGTGGAEFWSGGATSVKVATINGNGQLALTIGTPATTHHISLIDSANAASKTDIYSFLDGSGGTTFRVDPTSPDGTHQALVEFFRGTNTSSSRLLNFYKGDGTSTANAVFDVGNIFWKMAEVTAPSGAASNSVFWADSAAHRLKMNNNNGGAVQIVASGADINTSDQVTVTHLAAALPVNQGGTAQTVASTFPSTAGAIPAGYSCGATSTCANTAQGNTLRMFFGSAPLVSGTPSTVTVSGISPAYTSSSSYVCTVTNATNAANNLLKVANVSSSSFTITGPNTLTDTINFQCVGN